MAKASAALASKIFPLTITGKDGHTQRLDGKGLNLNYYESLLSPNITANLVFEDTGNAMKYKKAYDILMEYFEHIPDEEKFIVHRKLKELKL